MVLHSRKAVALGVAVAVLSVLAGDAGASTTWRQFGHAGAAARGNFGARVLVSSNTRLNPSQLRFVAVGDGASSRNGNCIATTRTIRGTGPQTGWFAFAVVQ